MENQGKNHHASSPSRSKKVYPSMLGPFLLEEESASPTLAPSRSTAAMPALPGPARVPPGAEHTGARPDKTGVKGFLTRVTASQSCAQLPDLRSKKSHQQHTYGPVLPLTEEHVKKLTGAPLTVKEHYFNTKLALKTRYIEEEDNRDLAKPSMHPPTRPYLSYFPAQPLPIYFILKDPQFDVTQYLRYPRLVYTDTSTSELTEGEYPISEDPPASDICEDDALQRLQHPLNSPEELLQPNVYKPSEEKSSREKSSRFMDSGFCPRHLQSNEMPFDTIQAVQPEQGGAQGEAREPAVVADDRAIHGNFIPVSHSHSNSRSRSSKHKQTGSYETILRLSLTDEQVDKITSALSNDAEAGPSRDRGSGQRGKEAAPQSTMRSRSPDKGSKTNSGLRRARSPNKRLLGAKTNSGNKIDYGRYEFEPEGNDAYNTPPKTNSLSPSKSILRSAMKQTSSMTQRTPSPTRGHRAPPAPIDTNIARQYAAESAQRRNQNHGAGPSYTLDRPPFESRGEASTSVHFANAANYTNFTSSSNYSPHLSRYPSYVSPLRFHRGKPTTASGDPEDLPLVPELGSYAPILDEPTPSTSNPTSSLLFSRFPRPGGDRKASKTLIGHNGWLEQTSMSRPGVLEPPKKPSFFNSVVKKAKHIMKPGEHSHSKDKGKGPAPPRALAISLNPREQSIVTNELEYALHLALEVYLTREHAAHRLIETHLKRVADAWRAKGRPAVVGFHYDLETQIEIVRLHVQELKFHGTANRAAIMGVLDMATTNARAMRYRTFCQPDTVLAKWLLDGQSVLTLVGGQGDVQWLVVEVTAFYKAAVEREEKLVKEKRELRSVKSVSEEKWNKTTPGGGARGGASGHAGQGAVRRTASYDGLHRRMDPTEYDEDY